MAKKNVTTAVLSEAALDVNSDVNPADDGKVISGRHFSVGVPLCRGVGLFGFSDSFRSVSVTSSAVEYPDSVTDQIHALSIADMIRQGQGFVIQEPSDYDFKPGERDDGSIEPHSLYELEWADPAQRYETEQKMNAEFSKSVITIDHDEAKKQSSDSSENTSLQDLESTVSENVDTK